MRSVLRNRLTAFKITSDNLNLVNASKVVCKEFSLQPEYVSGWGFRDEEGNLVSREFLMRKGGNQRLFKIRNIDSYLFAVKVFEPYRGNEYAGEMITWLFNKIHDEEGINELFLAVLKKNEPALRAYGKLGFEIIDSKFFIRLAKCNIPYYTL